MSGIAGILDFRNRAIEPHFLRSMADAFRHRGPDDEGYVLIDGRTGRHAAYCGAASPEELRDSRPSIDSAQPMESFNIGLSHRRFAVIDRSAAGHQPMFSSDGSICGVFDGRIYNHVELREELESLGASFRSRSNAEVVLESYRAWGTDSFRRFNGCWAIALHDLRSKRLFLSRDRLGKRAIYWARVDDRLFFASEIKSLLAVREIAAARRVNEAAVWRWCVDGRRDLDNETFFANIHSFPAAHWTVVDYDFPHKMRRYWELPRTRLTERKISVREATNLLRESLDDAVRIRLGGDTATAIELSGGLDSSAVLALAARREAAPRVAYIMRPVEQEESLESLACTVAERYGVERHVVTLDAGGFWNQIAAFTCLHEEPYHTPDLQARYAARSQIRSDGTDVVLTGAGGDELFAGSTRYYGRAQFENFLRGRWLRFASNTWRWKERREGFWAGVAEMIGARGSRALVQGTKRCSLWLENHPFRRLRASERHYAGTLSDSLYQEIESTRIPYWLRSNEKTYMNIPMEARCPFLDHRVVEVAARLPTTYLIRDGWHKWILRKAMEGVLPEEVIWRRAKGGARDRNGRFLDNDADIVDVILSEASNPYIDRNAGNDLRRDWNVVSFLLWYEYFINNNRPLFQRIEDMAEKRARSTSFGLSSRPQEGAPLTTLQ